MTAIITYPLIPNLLLINVGLPNTKLLPFYIKHILSEISSASSK